jgi:hypothetical protein
MNLGENYILSFTKRTVPKSSNQISINTDHSYLAGTLVEMDWLSTKDAARGLGRTCKDKPRWCLLQR